MPVTPYCTQTDVEALLSEDGVDASLDDNQDGQVDADADPWMSSMIEKATSDVNLYLLQRYTVAALAASAWVKWVTATFAAVGLRKRRGNPAPQSLLDDAERYLENLKAIATGAMALPGDTGLAAPQFDTGPTVSNMTVDRRYRRRKVRVVESTSTGSQPGSGVQRISANDYYLE
jgi:phage gp36-like protein